MSVAALRVMVRLKRGDKMEWVPIEISDDVLKSALLKLASATPSSATAVPSSAAATLKIAAKRGGGGGEKKRDPRVTGRNDESFRGDDHVAVDDAKDERASKGISPTEVEYIEFTGARRQRWVAIAALDVDTEWYRGMPPNTVASALLAKKSVCGDVLFVRLEPSSTDRAGDTCRPLDLEWSDWSRWVATAAPRK